MVLLLCQYGEFSGLTSSTSRSSRSSRRHRSTQSRGIGLGLRLRGAVVVIVVEVGVVAVVVLVNHTPIVNDSNPKPCKYQNPITYRPKLQRIYQYYLFFWGLHFRAVVECYTPKPYSNYSGIYISQLMTAGALSLEFELRVLGGRGLQCGQLQTRRSRRPHGPYGLGFGVKGSGFRV